MCEDGLKLVDMHLHLQDDAFRTDLDEVLLRANDSGVLRFVCNSTGPGDWEDVKKLALKNESIIACFGVHPWFVEGLEHDWSGNLESYLRSVPSFVGEIGLDRRVKGVNELIQKKVFIKQLELSKKLGVGVMVHCVKAWGEMTKILEEQGGFGERGGLFHAYSGSEELIKHLVEMGAYFSFGGYSINPRNTKLIKSLKKVPKERILLETDSPDMIAAKPFRSYCRKNSDGSERNEPANLRDVLREAAKIRGESEKELAEAIWINAKRFLGELIG